MSPKCRRQKTNSSIEFVSRNSITPTSFQSHFPENSNIHSVLEETKPIFYPFPIITYDPNKIPPNLDWAIRHGIAHRVAPLESLINSNDICESTGVPYTKNQLKLTCSLQRLRHLGPVFPMYFLMVKQIICIMLFLSLIAGGLGVMQYYETSWKSYHHYFQTIMEDLLQFRILIYGSFVVILLLLALMYKFRKDQKQLKLSCKEGNRSPSDYTLMVSDLDGPFNEEEIKNFFINYILQDFPLDVIRVTKTRDCKEYILTIRELSSLVDKAKYQKENKKIHKRIQEINAYFQDKKNLLKNLEGLKRGNIWFVTFNTRNEAKMVRRKFEFSPTQRFFLHILQKFSRDIEDYFLNGNFIKVEKAPEPSEIIWENLNSKNSSFCLSFVYVIISALLLLLTAASIYCVKALTADVSGKKWINAGWIALTNEIIHAFIIKFSQWEKFETITDKNITTTYKLVILQFLNMILPTYALELTIFRSQFDLMKFSLHLLCIATTCYSLPLFLRIFHFKHLYKLLLRIKAKFISSSSNMTQDHLNQIFENPEIQIHSLYSNTIKIFLFSCFNFSLSPGLALIALIALILTYWVDKYNLLRRSLLPSYLRSELSEALFEFLDFGLFLLALGKMALSLGNHFYPINPSISYDEVPDLAISGVGILVTFCYMLLPNKKLSRACLSVKKNDPSWICNLFYQQAFELFPVDYHTANPTVITDFVNNNLTTTGSQKFKEDYKEILRKFNGMEILEDCPEVLPMFAYAEKYPTFLQINKRDLHGLKDPYYIYPHNYGYGLIQLISPNSQKQANKMPLLLENNVTGIPKIRIKGAKSEYMNRSKSHNKTPCSVSRRSETSDMKSIIKEMSRMMTENNERSSNMESIYGGVGTEVNNIRRTEANTLNYIATDMSLVGGHSLDVGSMISGVSPICGKNMDQIDLDDSIEG